jgi:hypothetical protein
MITIFPVFAIGVKVIGLVAIASLFSFTTSTPAQMMIAYAQLSGGTGAFQQQQQQQQEEELRSIITTPATPEATEPSNTFDNELYGVRVHHPDGWIVLETEGEGGLISGPADSPRPVTYEMRILAMCPFSYFESGSQLRDFYDLAQRDNSSKDVVSLLCGTLPDGFILAAQPNLNKSESPYLNGKQNITIDDYLAFVRDRDAASMIYSNEKFINITDAVINVTDKATNQTIRQLPAKIVDAFHFAELRGEYETTKQLLVVDGSRAIGYRFYDLTLEDNQIVTDIEEEHRLLQGLELLE